ncbi:MAG TPA: carboxylesterase/lipase family protein [Candidatus Sulfotelmatobacter sp.]|nr:carboxylesterase/lipase family protein [Candidatus Sulfotelmatobacter sp.]
MKFGFSSIVGGMLFTALFAAVGLRGAGSEPTVKIDTGKLEGKSDGTISAFLGVPFAKPPVGDLRWKPPMKPTKWKGVRNATGFGSRCMQGAIYDDMIFRDPGISEDCLYLNVWTPSKLGKSKDKLPVMVWIYGGGFSAGATSEPRQDGTNIAKEGVVVVSMNYRLGIFGFFAHPELAKENSHNATGNYGLMDQSAALEWVKRNIAQFGGDPGNVTIFGESAGSFSVSEQMASPVSKGLFHKAIGESGGAFASHALPFRTKDESAEEGAKFAKDHLNADTLAALRAIPAQKVLDAQMAVKGERFAPNIDGYFLPDSPEALFAAGRQSDVPLLVGWNRDEGSFSVPKADQAAALKAIATKDFAAKSDEFLKLYPTENDEQAKRSIADYEGDYFIAFSTWRWIEAQRKTGKSPIYRYRFDMDHPKDPKRGPEESGAYHSAEIEFVFGALDSETWISWRPEDHTLTNLMRKYWSNFAKNGDPNGAGLPAWPKYNADTGFEVMHLDADPKAQKDMHRARYEFLSTFWAK